MCIGDLNIILHELSIQISAQFFLLFHQLSIFMSYLCGWGTSPVLAKDRGCVYSKYLLRIYGLPFILLTVAFDKRHF